MALKSTELAEVAREIDQGLHGAIVQKAYSPAPHEAWFELRQVGRSTLLCACARPHLERLSVADARPASPASASGFQQRLRKLLIGQRLEAVTASGLVATLQFGNARLELDSSKHTLTLFPGPSTAEAREPAPATAELALARSLEQRTAVAAADAGVDDAARQLERHLKKLRRTREKIAAEAARGALAEQHRRDGELLSRNLHVVRRGEASVRLTEYGEDGETSREVALDAKRTPKQQVEWLFHQYRRLQRGAAIAAERLEKLDREIAEAALPQARSPRPAAAGEGRALPYREYLTAKGQRIWVGRGSKHNDALTFGLAQPHHVWLHARGVPGAHVVVPLEKKQELDQETLLDAAHLAFHHSDARDERQGEVSYTHVRYLKKAGAPGAVNYTRESTFWLRVDPDRLRRLLDGAPRR